MAAEDLGTKRDCPECGAKFYDFGADAPFTCPKCSHNFTPEIAVAAVIEAAPKKAAPKKAVEPKVEDTDSLDKEMGGVEALEAFDDEYEEDVISLEEVDEHQEDSDNNINGDDANDEMFLGDINDKERIVDRARDYDELELDEEDE